ncbi:MAG: hypothetical protein ACYC6T_18680 [Thermoleophilia bacterium]
MNVKWYGRQEGLLDVSPEPGPAFYLVLAGPRAPAGSSKHAVRPWVIDHVHLFEHRVLLAALTERGVKVGVATSIPQAMWEAAEVHPAARNPLLPLVDSQTSLLDAFALREAVEQTRGSGVAEDGTSENRMRAVCVEVRGLFRILPMAAKRGVTDAPSLAHVLPGLLAKGHSDFAALCDPPA